MTLKKAPITHFDENELSQPKPAQQSNGSLELGHKMNYVYQETQFENIESQKL